MSTIFLHCLLMTAFLSYGSSAGARLESSDSGGYSIDFVTLSAASGKFDCDEAPESALICRVRAFPDVQEMELMLANGKHVSRQSDALTFVYRGKAERVWLRGGLQYPLSRVIGTNLWT